MNMNKCRTFFGVRPGCSLAFPTYSAFDSSGYRRQISYVLAIIYNVNSVQVLKRLCLNQGCWARAEQLCKRSPAILEKILGPDHPAAATIPSNLAEPHRAQGGFREAESLYKGYLAIREKVLGPAHPNVACSP